MGCDNGAKLGKIWDFYKEKRPETALRPLFIVKWVMVASELVAHTGQGNTLLTHT